MNNPERSFRTIDPSTMFSYSRQTNIPWGVREYRTPRFEVNADLQIKKRKLQSQKKGQKDDKHVTKRGFYMDYELKIAKSIPSPFSHGSQNSWDFSKQRKSGLNFKVDSKLSKNTYLQKIQLQQKNRKSPGIGSYSIQKSIKQKDEDKSIKKTALETGERIFFYENTQSLSNIVPGAGNYSPKSLSPNSRYDKHDYRYWIKKHKQQNNKLMNRESKRPAPGTHSPINTSITTFDQLAAMFCKPSKNNTFGMDAKFQYTRKSKKVILQKRPDPSIHSTIMQWKGKNSSNKLLSQVVWKGYTSSIYS